MPEQNPIKIEYEYPKFSRIAFSNLLDFLLCTLIALLIFIPTKKIVEIDATYITKTKEFDALKIDSNLYTYSSDKKRIQDVVTYYNESTIYSQNEMETNLALCIENFINFTKDKVNVTKGEEIKKTYDEFRTKDTLVYEGNPYFVIESGLIIKNTAANIPSKQYVENVYKYYIDNYALGQFISTNETALNYQKFFSDKLFFLEIPISLAAGIIIYFYIIPLCFSRGKKTFGKLAFQIGTVNSKLLSPKFLEFTINFLIFFFLECLLSVVALGVPLIISFSMSAFSKKRQNFHNYVTAFYLVDTNQKIYKNLDEITKEELKDDEPINFRQK